MKILIVEDQKSMLSTLRQGLEENDMEVDVTSDGISGLEMAISSQYHVIVMDVMMPGMSGIEVSQKLRNSGIKTPILFISALDAVEDKIAGLEAGGDDYLAKPFEFSEFITRIKVLNRRNLPDAMKSNLKTIDDLVINYDTWMAFRKDVNLDLTKKEFRLLDFFIKNEGKVLSKAEIASKVWDLDFDTGTNVVEVYVNYLRNKLDKGYENKFIHTKFGIGYIFNPK